MQALLKSTQKRQTKKNQAKRKKGKVIPEYDVFPVSRSTSAKVGRVGKTISGFPLREDVYDVLW